MNGYTVTITPSGTGRRGGKTTPQTTIQIDTTSGTARVTELTVHTDDTDGSGLSLQNLPNIDLAALAAALTPAATRSTTAPMRSPAQPRRGRPAREAATTTPKKTTRRRRPATALDETPTRSTGPTSRAYRRMPDQDDVIAAWNNSGSTTQVATHFDVPRHTAAHWLRRLRQTGAID
jgi:hypothetical protein